MQSLDSFPSWSLHCTVLLCQPVSQVLEQVIQGPVTHWGPGVGVEELGGVGEPGMRTGVAEEGVVVLLLVVVVVLVVVETVVVLSNKADFGLGLRAAPGCCGVLRGMKKL